LFSFKMDWLPPYDQGTLWSPDSQTLVLGWKIKKPSDLPMAAEPDIDRLPTRVRKVLTERLQPPGHLWLLGDVENGAIFHKWLTLPEKVGGLRFTPEQLKLVADLRTFAIWLETERDLTLRGEIRCSDEAAVQALRAYLQQTLKESSTA